MVNNHPDGKQRPPRVELDIRHILEQLGLDSKLAMQEIFKDHSTPAASEQKK